MRVSNKGLYPKRKPPLFRGGHYLYLQFDFISSLEYTIVNECNCKDIYEEIMMEYLSIKQTSEKWVLQLEEYRFSAHRDVYLVPQRLDHIGIFLQVLKNQTIKELRVVNI